MSSGISRTRITCAAADFRGAPEFTGLDAGEIKCHPVHHTLALSIRLGNPDYTVSRIETMGENAGSHFAKLCN